MFPSAVGQVFYWCLIVFQCYGNVCNWTLKLVWPRMVCFLLNFALCRSLHIRVDWSLQKLLPIFVVWEQKIFLLVILKDELFCSAKVAVFLALVFLIAVDELQQSMASSLLLWPSFSPALLRIVNIQLLDDFWKPIIPFSIFVLSQLSFDVLLRLLCICVLNDNNGACYRTCSLVVLVRLIYAYDDQK